MTEQVNPFEMEQIDIEQLKAELLEMKAGIAAEEQDEDTKLQLEIIDILLEEVEKRSAPGFKPSFREDVKLLSYVNFYEELMFDYGFEDEEFEFEDEDLEEEESDK